MPRLPRLVTSVDAKPRVLLVDDHRGVLEKLSSLLAADFEIAGLATDGRQAVDTAIEMAPELIVLDINMPGLNGFETKRALDERGSRAPVVFLSAADAEEIVIEAFRCGGRGYVLKRQVANDLPGALAHALKGGVFVSSLTSLIDVAPGGGHAMQIHGRVETFLDGLGALFDRALQRGDATCVIGTEVIREGLGRRLRAAGWDVGGESGHPRYRVMDAGDALGMFMRGGLPDAGLLAQIASELDQYRLATAEGIPKRLTIFGNMVAPLIAGGNAAAAIALENCWNRLTHGLPFLTICGYPTSCFQDDAPDVWAHACQEHWAVSHTHDV